MLTNNGMNMAMGIVWCFIGITALIFAVRNLTEKSSIPDMILGAGVQPSGKKKRLYRIAGYVFLYTAIISLLLGTSYILDKSALAYISASLALSGMFIILIKNFTRYDNIKEKEGSGR